jgi:hypothetical protein
MTLRPMATMRLEFSGPSLETLNGKRKSFPGERSRKLQTHRTPGPRRAAVASSSPATRPWSARSTATSPRASRAARRRVSVTS